MSFVEKLILNVNLLANKCDRTLLRGSFIITWNLLLSSIDLSLMSKNAILERKTECNRTGIARQGMLYRQNSRAYRADSAFPLLDIAVSSFSSVHDLC